MKYTYEISKLAILDLEEIWDFTAEQWSLHQANLYYDEIFSTIHQICTSSKIGVSIDEIKVDHKRINVKSHMIIYKIANNKIYIDRILHQKMDIGRHVND